MNRSKLLENLKALGYPMLEVDESINANATLAEVVKTEDLRFWESFPLLLAGSLEKNLFEYNKVLRQLKDSKDKSSFQDLIMMSLALYKYLELKLSYVDWLYNSKYFKEETFNRYLNSFKKKKNLLSNENQLSPDRMLNTFRNYFSHAELDLKEYINTKDEFELEYSMSQVFSSKQKELFLKKLKGEKMTKTEREYFSRSVRKKAQALANSDLHKLATKLVQE